MAILLLWHVLRVGSGSGAQVSRCSLCSDTSSCCCYGASAIVASWRSSVHRQSGGLTSWLLRRAAKGAIPLLPTQSASCHRCSEPATRHCGVLTEHGILVQEAIRPSDASNQPPHACRSTLAGPKPLPRVSSQPPDPPQPPGPPQPSGPPQPIALRRRPAASHSPAPAVFPPHAA